MDITSLVNANEVAASAVKSVAAKADAAKAAATSRNHEQREGFAESTMQQPALGMPLTNAQNQTLPVTLPLLTKNLPAIPHDEPPVETTDPPIPLIQTVYEDHTMVDGGKGKLEPQIKDQIITPR